MRNRPKSRWENEDGSINFALVRDIPENPEVTIWDKEFADGCDRLAEIEAVRTHKKHWGRWWLTKTSLNTRINRPKEGIGGFMRGGIYDIALDRLKKDWLEHMKQKNWIGQEGLRDLANALSELREVRGIRYIPEKYI